MNPAVVKRQDTMAVSTWQAQLGKELAADQDWPVYPEKRQPGSGGVMLNKALKRCVAFNTRSSLSHHSTYTSEKSTKLNTEPWQSQIIPGLTLHVWGASQSCCCGQWWWPCEAEASEAYCEIALCSPASNEASVWFAGNKSGIQDILRGLQVLAQKKGLEKTWGKIH